MADTAAVPMLVLARTEDFVSVINSTLRNAGLAVHCHWARDTRSLADALASNSVEMILAFVNADLAEATSVIQIRNQSAPTVPVIFIRERLDEEIIAAAMQLGARDVVTLASRGRLQAVVLREVRAFRAERELAGYKNTARQSHDQVKAIMADTGDAIAFVQEGIVVDVNSAWCTAFGRQTVDQLVGHPLMDFLDASSQPAFKSALSACAQNKWTGQTIQAVINLTDNSTAQLEFRLARGDYDGDPAVRLSLVAKQDEIVATPAQITSTQVQPAMIVAAAAALATQQPSTTIITAAAAEVDVGRDLSTQLWQRRVFIERLATQLNNPPTAGSRILLMLAPDKHHSIEEELGPLALEEFMAQFAATLRTHFKSDDLLGRYNDCTIAALVERGAVRDIEATLTNAMSNIAARVFEVNGKSIIFTLSAGICVLDARARDFASLITDALRTLQEAQAQGGNRQQIIDRTEADTRQLANDAIWVRMIKSALMDNRFKLMQQPIASLLGGERGMFDVLVRMVDEQGDDVLPTEFMDAAARNDLMKNIDRWVISNAMTFAGTRQVQRLFVRVSRDSVRDKSLAQWLTLQLKSTRIDADRITFQVSELVANECLADTAALGTALRQAGFKFALEHFGSGRESARLLSHLPLDYLKIDGSLMQGLAVNTELQQRVKELVDAARNRKVATIAERVEDANTMAVLWQLGVEYIQGYFVNEPEQVVMG